MQKMTTLKCKISFKMITEVSTHPTTTHHLHYYNYSNFI